jgi:hypothetical protein
MGAGRSIGHDHAMNPIHLLVVVTLVSSLPVAIRRIGGGDGIGLVELFENALSPLAAPGPQGHAVPEPEFVPWRFGEPQARVAPQRAVEGGESQDLATAA